MKCNCDYRSRHFNVENYVHEVADFGSDPALCLDTLVFSDWDDDEDS